MNIDFRTYKEKVRSCFVGKTIGGTLGMNLEGNLDYHPEVSYYDPVPTGMLPNDDLDFQVLNLEAILKNGLPINRYHLGELWSQHQSDFCPDEYHIATYNFESKIFAPLCGAYRNKFYAGMGSAIRSELWACLAPCNPDLAVKLCREDACSDHTEDGIYAEMFLAAVESAAFEISDIRELMEIGIKYIPAGNRLGAALRDTVAWWDEAGDILTVREKILAKYRVANWTDVTINLSFILLAMLSCEDSFDKAICNAVSLGYDADCTGATVGSLFAIINPHSIDEKWTMPIGNSLLLSPGVVNAHSPRTIDDFCDLIISVAMDVKDYYNTGVDFVGMDNIVRYELPKAWTDNAEPLYSWKVGDRSSLVNIKPFMVEVLYSEEVAADPEKSNKYTVRLTNLGDTDYTGTLGIRLPFEWKASKNSFDISLGAKAVAEYDLEITLPADRQRGTINIMSLDFDVNGVSFTYDAGLPVTIKWEITDLATNEVSYREVSAPFFKLDAGSYRCRLHLFSPSPRDIKLVASGDRKFVAYLNGKEEMSCGGDNYIPAFHRGKYNTRVVMNAGDNMLELVVADGDAGEVYVSFGLHYGCGRYISAMEYVPEY
ncbi:MAG: ADP-ribosylglycohydrolase family protein [Clostridia bacterium]|nr:ADP-ribosylglycohydrolase family protein [Clostridia bacterium]